jgi:hypothetical protein
VNAVLHAVLKAGGFDADALMAAINDAAVKVCGWLDGRRPRAPQP